MMLYLNTNLVLNQKRKRDSSTTQRGTIFTASSCKNMLDKVAFLEFLPSSVFLVHDDFWEGPTTPGGSNETLSVL